MEMRLTIVSIDALVLSPQTSLQVQHEPASLRAGSQGGRLISRSRQPVRQRAQLRGTGALGMIGAVTLVASSMIASPPAGPSAVGKSDEAKGVKPPSEARNEVKALLGSLPLRFDANQGQTDEKVRFVSRNPGYTLFLSPGEVVVSLARPGHDGRRSGPIASGASKGPKVERSVLRMRFLGANRHPELAGDVKLPGISNHLVGDSTRWRRGIPGYSRAIYRQLYPGVDLVFHGKRGRLEYDFIVAPGTDPARIRWAVKGAKKLSVSDRGDLLMRTRAGTLRHEKPYVYQKMGKRKVPVSGKFVIKDDTVSFQLGPYDLRRTLVIDPSVSYSTYIGGSSFDEITGIAVDGSGSAYVTGMTQSVNFPVESAVQAENAGDFDAFVTKVAPSGFNLIYSTYLGGTAFDGGGGIAVDDRGSAFVTGSTSSTDFPTGSTCSSDVGAVNPLQDSFAGGAVDAFVAKLKPDGSSLAYSTYLGGKGDEVSESTVGPFIAIDPEGSPSERSAYVAGQTSSPDFPTSVAAFQSGKSGDFDAFVSKLNACGSQLSFSTFLGGGDIDEAFGIAVDKSDAAYVTGSTLSTDFPTLGPLQGMNSGSADAFVTKFDPSGATLTYSTYLGGAGSDAATGVAVNALGEAHIAGVTSSGSFPTASAFQPEFGGGGIDAFVTKLNSFGSEFSYSTFLGGGGVDAARGIAVDSEDNAVVTGRTHSNNFPVLNSMQGSSATTANAEAFVTKFTPGGNPLRFSTYLGGTLDDRGVAVATGPQDFVYVAGRTSSDDFPTADSFQSRRAGSEDGFLAKIISPLPGSGTWAPGGDLNLPRFSHTATVLQDGRVLVVGGCATPTQGRDAFCPAHSSTAEIYDPRTLKWSIAGSMTTLRSNHTATLLSSGKILVAGGCITPTDAFTCTATASAEIFDPATRTWAPAGVMKTARRLHSATLLENGKVLVTGGLNENESLSSAELFDPAANFGVGDWTAVTASLASPRNSHTADLLPGGRVLLAGGLNGTTALATAEIYDPADGAFSPTGSLASPRAAHTSTRLPDGRILLAGGLSGTADDATSLASAELYDPTKGRFTTTEPMTEKRSSHAAAPLPGGMVLVAGGRSSPFVQGPPKFSAEVYDPVAGVWSLVDEMQAARSAHPATNYNPTGHTLNLLSGGKVLVVGGTDSLMTELFVHSADLSVSQIDSPDPVALGDELSYTLQVSNEGPDTAASVKLSDTLSPALSFVSATAGSGTCVMALQTVTCDLRSIESGGIATVTIVVEPTATGTVSNTASVASSTFDPDSSDNTTSSATAVVNTFGCTIVGTAGNDTLAGGSGADVICGLGGNDSITGGNGSDRLIGGSGNDLIEGGKGDDILEGQKGDDVLSGQSGNDALTGAAGADDLDGGDGDDSLDGADGIGGNDQLNGAAGRDRCSADPGDVKKLCEH